MYLDSEDYQTVWNLAHNWSSSDSESTDPKNIPKEVQLYLHRLAAAIFRNQLSARNKKRVILIDNSLISLLIDLRHFKKLRQCTSEDIFDKAYLNSIYVRRTHVIDWCAKEYLQIPPIWRLKDQDNLIGSEYDSSDDENEGWYNDLSDRRKKRVACLEMAKKLWLINPELTYDEIFNHPTMKQFGNPNVFSLEAFKKWSRPFSTEYAREGGRPKENK